MPLYYKVGFLGAGNLAQSIIRGLIEKNVIPAEHLFATNRSPGKLLKLTENYKIQAKATNEELVDTCDVIILATKPQDLAAAIDPLAHDFTKEKIVISLAAGVTLRTLEKKLPQARIVRVMPNTPTLISRGVLGYVMSRPQAALETVVEDLFNPLGYVVRVEDEQKFEALTIACSSGTGFVFEMMSYWQDWLEERLFEPEVARKMTVETFLGTALLAAQSGGISIEELLAKVTSKKGVTLAGLESMRELDLERILRVSFEKAALRNQELANQS